MNVHFCQCVTLLPPIITEPLKLWAKAKGRLCLLRQHLTGDLPHSLQSRQGSLCFVSCLGLDVTKPS